MPVKSLNSSVLVWPNKETVVNALEQWAKKAYETNPGLIRVGYFGSYARGDWGVGSDLDVVLILKGTGLPFEQRAVLFDLTELPVAVDVIVYTLDEWEKLTTRKWGKKWWEEVRWV